MSDLDLSGEKPEKTTLPGYNPDMHRDNVRKMVSIWLLVILSACVLIVAGTLIWKPQSCEGAKDVALLLFTPVLTTVSSILGFYFGEKASS